MFTNDCKNLRTYNLHSEYGSQQCSNTFTKNHSDELDRFFENEFTKIMGSLRPFDDNGHLDLSTKEKTYGMCILLNTARETWNVKQWDDLLEKISSTIECEKKKLNEFEAIYEFVKVMREEKVNEDDK